MQASIYVFHSHILFPFSFICVQSNVKFCHKNFLLVIVSHYHSDTGNRTEKMLLMKFEILGLGWANQAGLIFLTVGHFLSPMSSSCLLV